MNYYLDEFYKLFKPKSEEKNEAIKVDEDFPVIMFYINKKCVLKYILKFDEVSIGRKSNSSNPDIDISKFDPDKKLSRKLLDIFKIDDNYYIVNKSSNNVFFNSEKMIKDELYYLEDNTKIIAEKTLGILIKNKGEL